MDFRVIFRTIMLVAVFIGMLAMSLPHSHRESVDTPDIPHICQSGHGHHHDDKSTSESSSPTESHVLCCFHSAFGLPLDHSPFIGLMTSFLTWTITHDSLPESPTRAIDYPPQLS